MTIHPTALVEAGVEIGRDTQVWDNVHLRGPSAIGRECIIGEKTHVAYGVTIGDRVKINARAYICAGVTIEDGVMVSAGVIFTNDRYPRATNPELTGLRSSAPGEHTLPTTVREGATLGAGAVIGPGLEVGRFAMVGMGSVVTRNVDDFTIVTGNPARRVGVVCRCGEPLTESDESTCRICHRAYRVIDGKVEER